MTPDQRSHSPSYGLQTKTDKSNRKPNPLEKQPSQDKYIITCNECDLQDGSHYHEDMEEIKNNHVCEGEPKIFRLARCKL
jgi:hypothetical protein